MGKGKQERYNFDEDDSSANEGEAVDFDPSSSLPTDGTTDSESGGADTHDVPTEIDEAVAGVNVDFTFSPTIPNTMDKIDSRYPYVHSRKSTMEGRDLLSIYGSSGTEKVMRRFELEVSEHFAGDIDNTDIREAAFLAGMMQPEAVIGILKMWGCEP